ncbi:hypothetical protein [Nocardioides sp. AE5]|uniref:hypothetical protein n=1 Tax=Nocardioides sp. AE5 TaxID=2962573 RepID=UPI0028826F65|nr:hypothetical protein [Nocardioides sp. AE5]MDT0201689.1 hypothetical protein [Nocardioides sp. AE5]
MASTEPETTAPHRGWAIGTAIAVLASLVLGWVVANGLSGFLAIEFHDKELPDEQPVQVTPTEVGPLAGLAGLDLPDEVAGSPRGDLATRLLDEALDARELTGETITVSVSLAGDASLGEEGYVVTSDPGQVTVEAHDPIGATNALFRIADLVAAGHDWADVVSDGPVVPELADRFVDTGAVGVRADEDAYRAQADYQHASGALEDVVLSEPPYVDPDGLEALEADWKQFIDHVVAYGYNGVVIPGFLEYVNFDRLGDGFEVYGPDSPYRARHEVMKRDVGEIWQYADAMGLRVVFKSDMLALTTPLEEYLARETGLDANDEALWEVYRAGLDEFLGDFEWADGFMIRIGEGGSIYNLHGWDYYSALEVTDAAGVRTMLETATDVAADHDADIYFRTWSVGVGDVGDMHTNPETYDHLFDGFVPDNLVVSTKFVMGDFDSYLPLNPTLATGEQRRLVEMQGRREFEAFNSIPDDLGPAHQVALRELRGANQDIDGLWMWTQDGGPWRAGPMSHYLKAGNWELYDLNVYTGGRLGWDPQADLGAAEADWIARTYGNDPAVVEAVGEVFSLSRAAVLDGLYVRPYAERQVFALGLEPPPMMWIFKWDIVSGDTAALAAVYSTVAEHPDGVLGAIKAGESAVATAEQMQQAFLAVPQQLFDDRERYVALASALEYEVDLLRTLQVFRVLFLRYYEWLDTGDSAAYDEFRGALPAYHAAVTAHEQKWHGNLDLPPYNFFAADAGMEHAERVAVTRPAALALALAGLLALVLLPALRSGAFMPWRVRGDAPAPTTRMRWLVLAVPVVVVVGARITFSSALSPWYLVATLGSLALLGAAARGVLAWLRPGADGFWIWAGLGGALVLRSVLFMAAVGVRGPGGYWYRFWIDETTREIYVTLAFAAFLHSLVVVVVVLGAAYGLRLRQGIGAVLIGIGAALLLVSALLGVPGLETALTKLNDEMAVLPLGLSRILGLTVHLGIPSALPTWLLVAGVVAALGGVLAAAGRRVPAAP